MKNDAPDVFMDFMANSSTYEKYEYEHLVVGTSNQHFIIGSYTETKV